MRVLRVDLEASCDRTVPGDHIASEYRYDPAPRLSIEDSKIADENRLVPPRSSGSDHREPDAAASFAPP